MQRADSSVFNVCCVDIGSLANRQPNVKELLVCDWKCKKSNLRCCGFGTIACSHCTANHSQRGLHTNIQKTLWISLGVTHSANSFFFVLFVYCLTNSGVVVFRTMAVMIYLGGGRSYLLEERQLRICDSVVLAINRTTI